MANFTNGLTADPLDSLRKMAEAIEEGTGTAMEQLISGEGFSELLVRVTENVLALANVNAAIWEQMLRNLRLAGLRDIDRLARQMTRNEEKLELLWQAVERLEAPPKRGE
jgi:hypothetical protein